MAALLCTSGLLLSVFISAVLFLVVLSYVVLQLLYSWRIKHVVIDPNKLETYPIVNGQWPKDRIPWIESEESDELTGPAEVLK